MQSKNFKHWIAILDNKTCYICEKMDGKIYSVDEPIYLKPPIHFACRCAIEYMQSKIAGTATNNGLAGADYWLKYYNQLPNYYITLKDALSLGWRSQKKYLDIVAPGMMLFKGEYKNHDGHLPMKSGRIWHEADINYTSGKRGKDRILFSNDGLIFVSYDHYEHFYEII